MQNKNPSEKLYSAIYEKIGAASMCWSETPKGIFQDQKASCLANEIVEMIKLETIKKPKGVKEQIIFFFKGIPKGVAIYLIEYSYHSLLMWLGLLLWYPIPYIKVFGIFMTLRMFRAGIIVLKGDKNNKNGE